MINSRVTSIQKRGGGGPTFASNTQHTPVFNTVHIIAAVIGIVGAIAVFITIIVFCRRKRNKKSSIQKIKSDIEANMIQTQRSHHNTSYSFTTTTTTTAAATGAATGMTDNRFGQFANDFNNSVEPPKPAIFHVEEVSPMMQQYQLQLKLLQQQQQERKQSANSLQVPTHNRASSSSSSASSSHTLLPPPPYHP